MALAAAVLGPTAAAALSVAFLLGLPLLVAAAAVAVLVHQERREGKAGQDEPWWHAHVMEDEQAAGSSGQRLMGGSRPGALPSCNHCSKADPPMRCGGCSSVAYCSRECQQADWKGGHKHACKKLRKQRQAEARRSAVGEADGGSAGAADSAAAAGSQAKGGGSKERPEESNSTPPLPKQVLYPAERYVELAAAPPQRKAPLGLVNVGNSCYANSLLQSLIATPALAAYLVSGEHGRGCRKPSASDWCALCELEKLAQQAYDKSSGCLSPKPLLKHVKRLGKQFSFGRQEDSHELYLRIMEAIEAVQLVEAGGKGRWDLRSRETVLIHHVFGGYTRNQVACRSCGHVSRTYEACTSLTLEVSARVTSLEAALQRFAAVERLDGDNKYKCDGCKSYVAADKSTRIEAAPHNLNICLKRFAPGRYGKITTRLTFPETLDLSPYMAEGSVDAASGSGPPLYHLYAVVVHIDWGRSTDYGHYIAYVKCGGTWFQCDDSSVTPVAAAKALSAGAYLLFYEREAPRRILTADEAAAVAPAKAAVAAESAAESVASVAEEGAAPAAAVADEAAASRQSGMLRVETAPASLPHLGAAASSSSLSAASSQDLPVVLEAQEARQHRAARAIEAGTPEALHASVSESDLLAAGLRSGGTAAIGAVTAASVASLGLPSSIAEEAAEAGLPGSPSARLEQQQQQELAAAADQARLEVQARAAQQQGSRPAAAATSGGSTPSSSRSGGGSSGSGGGSTEFRPTANPFNLLVPDDSEEGSDGSSSSSSSESDSETGAVEAEAEVVGTSSTAGEEEEPLLDEPAGASAPADEQANAAAEAEQQAAGSTAAAAEAEPAAAQPADAQPAEAAAAAGTAADADADADADDAGLQVAEQHASTHDAAAAKLPAEEQPLPASSSASAAPTNSQQNRAGGEVAAAAARGEEGKQPQPAAEQQSSTSTAAAAESASTEEACTPAHRASLKCVADGKRVLRLSVDLPGVESLEHVDWRVQAGGSRAGGSASQQLLLRAAQWQLALPLPVPVKGGSAAAKWARQKLTVTWPVV